MNLLLDSLLRAVAYCLHPRVIVLSILPLALMGGVTGGLAYFFWEPALDHVGAALETSALVKTAWSWLEQMGVGQLKSVLAPMIIIVGITPFVVVGCLLTVALLMSPVIVSLVARRRFPEMQRNHGANFFASLAWSGWSTLLALLAMVVSIPLWLVPPLVLLLPPLIWGWLTYRVMAFDALSEHASIEERRTIFSRHRAQLVGIGVFAGYLGAAPSLIWSVGVMTIVMAPILVPVSIWLYTLIFAFSSLWFAHYCLFALQDLRAERERAALEATTISPSFDML